MKGSRFELRVKLRADKKWMVGKLDNFYQIFLRMNSGNGKTVLLKLVTEFVV